MTVLVAVSHVVVDQVTQALGIQDSGWAIFAAIAAAVAAVASAVAAAATTVLALWTRNLVKKTGDMSSATHDMVEKTGESIAAATAATASLISNENNNHRINATVDVLNRYIYDCVPMTREISITAHIAHSQIMNASKDVGALVPLKVNFEHWGPIAANLQYRIVKESFPIVLNFYMNAGLLLRQNIIDERIFMNPFAKTFIALYEAMLVVGPAVGANMAPVLALNNFRQRCEDWLKEVEATGEDTVNV